MRWKIAVLVVAAIALSAASCEACYFGQRPEPIVFVRNESNETVVVEYLAMPIDEHGTQQVLRLEPGERGGFRPTPADKHRLAAPILVRSDADGRIFARAEPGESFLHGLVIIAREYG